jgi:hypothetical protein
MSKIPGWLEQFSEHSKAPIRPFWDRWFQGIAVVLMLAVPLGLWWFSKRVEFSLKATQLSQCPAAQPVSVKELLQHPERFQHRVIWLVGRIQRGPLQCLGKPCPRTSKTSPSHKACCPPCQAFLTLQAGASTIPLRGQMHARPLMCTGTRCALQCRPMQPGFVYGISGTVRVKRVQGRRGRWRYKLRSFWVREGCLITRPNQRNYATPAVRDPLHKSSRKQQL